MDLNKEIINKAIARLEELKNNENFDKLSVNALATVDGSISKIYMTIEHITNHPEWAEMN